MVDARWETLDYSLICDSYSNAMIASTLSNLFRDHDPNPEVYLPARIVQTYWNSFVSSIIHISHSSFDDLLHSLTIKALPCRELMEQIHATSEQLFLLHSDTPASGHSSYGIPGVCITNFYSYTISYQEDEVDVVSPQTVEDYSRCVRGIALDFPASSYPPTVVLYAESLLGFGMVEQLRLLLEADGLERLLLLFSINATGPSVLRVYDDQLQTQFRTLADRCRFEITDVITLPVLFPTFNSSKCVVFESMGPLYLNESTLTKKRIVW